MRRPLLISGFMATGKSAAARALARLSGRPCFDLDAEIERQAGKSIRDIFASDGEARFRELERELLLGALDASQPRVIALGGGALMNRESRLLAMERGVVVTLSANLDAILRRGQSDSGQRPLLEGKNRALVAQLLELRAPAYAEAHEQLSTDELTPDGIAERLLEIWRRDPIGVAAGHASYSVEVGRGHAARRAAEDSRGAPLALMISDTTVDGLHGHTFRDALSKAGVAHDVLCLPPGEEHKNPNTLAEIWDFALRAGADRKSRFIGVGGGVVTDVTGFSAATWMRGVPWLCVPTTLLGMVDASVGGKTAVDLPGAKNCVGAFWQPRRVLCDVGLLATEPDRGFKSALAEVVKTALLGDAELFTLLEQETAAINAKDPELVEHLVRRCIAVKASIVSRDERESGLRAALNLGHTVGHALEAHGGYGRLTHGEAISLGLVAALRIGQALGVGTSELTARVLRVLAALGLPIDLDQEPLAQAIALINHDKKRAGKELRFVLCPEPGRIEFRSLPLDELQRFFASL